jgi:hypothetical protein
LICIHRLLALLLLLLLQVLPQAAASLAQTTRTLSCDFAIVKNLWIEHMQICRSS